MLKKIFIALSLVLLAAGWNTSSARWVIDTSNKLSASEIKAGDTVVIRYAASEAQSDYYIQVADGDYANLGVVCQQGIGLGAAAVITFEEGPLDIRTDEPTFYIKLVGSDKYISKEHNYDWYNYGQNVTSSIDKAANFQIISCGEEIPWYDASRSDNFTKWTKNSDAIWDDKSVGFAISPSGTDFAYLSYWTYASSSPRVITWKYTNTIEWDVYRVSYEEDVREDLEALINTYTSASADYEGGTNPGFFDQAAIDAFDLKMQEALVICYTPSSTNQEMKDIMQELKDARDKITNTIVPITEDYYYLINDNEKISTSGKAEKAMYINETTKQMGWREFDATSIDFIFYFTPDKANNGTWDVQGIKSGLYIGQAPAFCKVFTASETEVPVTFNCYKGTGSYYLKTLQSGGNTSQMWTLCPQGNASGTADGPNAIWSYNGETTSGGNVPHAEWTWQLRRVPASEIDKFLEAKAQVDRTKQLSELINDAKDLYGNLFTYSTDTNNGLITDADTQLTFKTIRRQGIAAADQLAFLIDNDPTTYMQGAGYIDAGITATPVDAVSIYYARRAATEQYPNAGTWGEQERPGSVTILASNDTVGENAWTEIKTINMANLEEPIMATVNLSDTYSYIRFQVNTNKEGGSYFTLSEFQLYKATIDQTQSQYYTAEGIQSRAESMLALANTDADIVAANTATNDDIAALKAAIASVRELYADTATLVALINECEELVNSTTVGDALGQVKDQAAINSMTDAIADARKFVRADISKADLDEATTNLQNAYNNFLAAINSFEQGKWYYITNADATEESTVANTALYMSGYAENSNAKAGKLSEDLAPLYTYDPYSMWTFEPATATNQYYVRNLGTGFYLGDFTDKGEKVTQSFEGVAYRIKFIGNGAYSLIPASAENIAGYGVTASTEGNTVFAFPEAGNASTWALTEINPDELECITISEFGMNCQDVIVLPYNVSDLSGYNDNVKIYGIRKITQTTNEQNELVSTIEFYEKSSLKAGEPAWIVLGDPSQNSEANELIIPFPTEVTNTTAPENALVGMLTSLGINEGDVFSTGKELTVAGEGIVISAHTGAIVPKYYTGEVSGVETAYTLTITGMNEIPNTTRKADVNGDGKINATDVVSIYNYIINGEQSGITAAQADVNGDDKVNATDVVSVYNYIINGDAAGSKAFQRPQKIYTGE